mmetsp:Transcript_46817/g.108238  ORF Transcript_46817/g.108238 Transcript_46817/m.108238 type:complete len:330 (-) Transcript_46817:34-1023(-)
MRLRGRQCPIGGTVVQVEMPKRTVGARPRVQVARAQEGLVLGLHEVELLQDENVHERVLVTHDAREPSDRVRLHPVAPEDARLSVIAHNAQPLKQAVPRPAVLQGRVSRGWRPERVDLADLAVICGLRDYRRRRRAASGPGPARLQLRLVTCLLRLLRLAACSLGILPDPLELLEHAEIPPLGQRESCRQLLEGLHDLLSFGLIIVRLLGHLEVQGRCIVKLLQAHPPAAVGVDFAEHLLQAIALALAQEISVRRLLGGNALEVLRGDPPVAVVVIELEGLLHKGETFGLIGSARGLLQQRVGRRDECRPLQQGAVFWLFCGAWAGSLI